MPYGALTLHEGLRLRSRRVRCHRSQRLTAKSVLTLLVLAASLGYFGAPVGGASAARLGWTVHPPAFGAPFAVALPGRANAAPQPPDSRATDEQRYLEALWPIHAELQQTLVSIGLSAAFYESQDIDRAALKSRVDQGLATYRDAEARMQALEPPPTLRGPHAGYLEAVRMFQDSAIEMSKMFDDGDEAHLTAALPLSLEGSTRLRELGDHFWPSAS